MNYNKDNMTFIVLPDRFDTDRFVNINSISEFWFDEDNKYLRICYISGGFTDLEVESLEYFLKYLNKARKSNDVVVYP